MLFRSQYQAANDPSSTFQASISKSDKDYKDEQKAVEQYQQIYGTQGSVQKKNDKSTLTTVPGYPNLSMSYTTSPDLIPLPNTGGSSGSGSSAPQPEMPVFIELGTLMSTETSFIGATQALVNDYENTLVPLVRNAIGSSTFFGQSVGAPTGVAKGSKASEAFPTEKADPLDQEGVKFAAAINPQMGKLLQAAGNMIEALGVFTSRINMAGQYYTDTDAQSAFPPPGLMEGPNITGLPGSPGK